MPPCHRYCVDAYPVIHLPEFIGKNSDTEKLYELESKAAEIVKSLGAENARIFKQRSQDYWNLSIPMALAGVLGKFQTATSLCAAVSYLKALGWKVEAPSEELDGKPILSI